MTAKAILHADYCRFVVVFDRTDKFFLTIVTVVISLAYTYTHIKNMIILFAFKTLP